jgi:glycosyltransferase involved in cell wall biosynthesis
MKKEIRRRVNSVLGMHLSGIAHNACVIATDAGWVNEDITHGENGLIIPFNDRGQAFEQAIIETIGYLNRFKVGDEIHLKANQFTFFEDQTAELGRIYNHVLTEREKYIGANTACVVA